MAKKSARQRKAAGKKPGANAHPAASPTQNKSFFSRAYSALLPSTKAPYGINFIIAYNFFIGLFYIFYLFLGSQVARMLFFGYLVSERVAQIVNGAYIVVIIIFLFGLSRKRAWAFKFGLFWYGLGIIDAFLSIISVMSNILQEMYGLMVFFSLSIIIVNSVSLWYIYRKRDYFIGSGTYEHYGKDDRVLFYSVVGVWTMLIVFIIFLGYSYYSLAEQNTPGIVEAISDKDFFDCMKECSTMDGPERDLCYMLVAMKFEYADAERLHNICNKISIEFFRFSCYQGIA